MPLTIAMIGRPNVGKSTLFNSLVGKKHALVSDIPGTTRDRQEGLVNLADINFRLIDTAGLEEADDSSIEAKMMKQTAAAVQMADLVFLTVDAAAGLTPQDRFFAKWVRQQGKPVLLLANKADAKRAQTNIFEFHQLGFDPIPVSATHKQGFSDLYEALVSHAQNYNETFAGLDPATHHEEGTDPPMQLAIIGRPNTGKSTLMNALLNEERMITGEESGMTRNAIAIDWDYQGHAIRLIDTAGMRKRRSVDHPLESLSVSDTYRALCFAHVAILVIDATMPFEKQDLTVAELAMKEGRAMVIGLNKWDQIKDKKTFLKQVGEQAGKIFPDIPDITIIPISALNRNNLDTLVEAAIQAYAAWNKRIPTAKLNQWIAEATRYHLPPLGKHGKPVKIKYVTQIKSRPPTFTLFCNRPEELPAHYLRYLAKSIRETFGIHSVPLRLYLRKSDNPYANRKKKRA